MASDQDKRWRCSSCGVISLESEFLSAPNPFNEEDTLIGCPNCFAINDVVEICDEPGCEIEASCGFPVDDPAFGGYRRTCYKHRNSKYFLKEVLK